MKFFFMDSKKWAYFSSALIFFIVMNMRSCNWYRKLTEPKVNIELSTDKSLTEKFKTELLLDGIGIEPSKNYILITKSVNSNDNTFKHLFQSYFLQESIYIKYPQILDTLKKRYFIKYNSITDSVKKDEFTLDVLMRAKYLLDSNVYQIFVKKIKTNIRI